MLQNRARFLAHLRDQLTTYASQTGYRSDFGLGSLDLCRAGFGGLKRQRRSIVLRHESAAASIFGCIATNHLLWSFVGSDRNSLFETLSARAEE
jgi:hypothetical protein